jgi:general L-amino acid transport system permease protein
MWRSRVAEVPRLPAYIPARVAPAALRSRRTWLRRELLGSWPSAVATALLLVLGAWGLWACFDWGVWHAVWRADAEQCQAARGVGACWGVVAEKHRIILFGRYPHAEHWRPLLASSLLAATLGTSCLRRCWRPWLLGAWLLMGSVFFVLMHGGVAGLSVVPTELWGGLPLTLLLATLGIVLAYPLAIAVALGRRSEWPALRSLCTVYIELVRGVPLISVLFMASFMFPLLLPVGQSPDVLLRVLVGITLFAAAYLAEIVRGGLQSLPRGQSDAGLALGLSGWQLQRYVVLPQALAAVLPGIMNSFIAIFKDTSLVTIVSMYELTGALSLALNADAQWRPFKLEGYLFIAAIYFVGCLAMSRYSLWIEAGLQRGRAR